MKQAAICLGPPTSHAIQPPLHPVTLPPTPVPDGDFAELNACVVALFLRGMGDGWSPLPWRLAPNIVATLQRDVLHVQAADLLARRLRAFPLAAAALTPDRLAFARELLEAGKAIGPFSPGYPHLWRSRGGPPALWSSNCAPAEILASPPALAVLGSREPSEAACSFLLTLRQNLSCVVSGGAMGVDRLIERPNRTLCLLASGLSSRHAAGRWDLALAPEGTPFSAALAMERNAYLYRAVAAAIVVEPRYGIGGSWHGAVAAARQGEPLLAVFPGPAETHQRAARALAAAGVTVLRSAEDALAWLPESLRLGTMPIS